LIARENQRRGTAEWRSPAAPPQAISAYGGQVSVAAGDGLTLHVATSPPSPYRLAVYRLGFYGGPGARLMVETERGEWREGAEREQPVADPETGLVAADWPATDYVQTGEEWPSGQYLAVLRLVTGRHAGQGCTVPFVVRPRLGARSAAALIQMPATTAQAYNEWGGHSLAAGSAWKVSFDRPVLPLAEAAPSARSPLWWDLPLVRFLEREGVDLDYAADVDVHRDPACLLHHRLVILSGHGACWTTAIRDGFDAAVRRGVNLACLGADTGSRCVGYENSERTIVATRPDPATPTDGLRRFRDLRPPRPERRLLGVECLDSQAPSRGPRRFVATDAARSDPWLVAARLRPGDAMPGLVADAWDTMARGDVPPERTVLLHYPGGGVEADAHAIRFQAPSGALVFSAGSLPFAGGLERGLGTGETDPRLQRMVRRALIDLIADRRLDEAAATERELAGAAARVKAKSPGVPIETPIHASAAAVWPALTAAITGWRGRVSAEIAPWDGSYKGDLDTYLEAGQSALWSIQRALAGAGESAPGSVLDLPCGTARVTRVLRAAWPAARVVAADTSKAAVSFCEKHCGAEPWQLASYHDLDVARHRDRYDLIWSGSLLAQVPPPQLDATICDLVSLLAPNGVLVAAFRGRNDAHRLRTSAEPQLRGLADVLERSGSAFALQANGAGVSVLSAQMLVGAVTSHRAAMLMSLTERGWLDQFDVVAVMRKDVHHPHGNYELC
jgi:SAM-dependent methyltransferase